MNNICADLADALDQVRRQYDRALDITLFILLTEMKLAGEADSRSGSLSYTVDTALETVELIANGLATSGGKRESIVSKILKATEAPVFDGWDHWRYDLVQLAGKENEGKFYHLLNCLSDQQWKKFQDTPKYGYGEKIRSPTVTSCVSPRDRRQPRFTWRKTWKWMNSARS